MTVYACTQCGLCYSPEETIQHYDYLHGDLYVICPNCRSECRREENEGGNAREEKEDE